ncbi:MAG TPA: tetratricopeptide repeat protein [Flavobacteriales bacterium]|nr:tetratricopeptide repeat protein [Flavobacteriales bacterium]
MVRIVFILLMCLYLHVPAQAEAANKHGFAKKITNENVKSQLERTRKLINQGSIDDIVVQEHLEKIIDWCKKNNRSREKGEAYLLLGNNEERQGNYDIALKYYNTSMGIYEAIEDKHGIATNENAIGVIYWYLEYHQKAIDCFEKAAKLNAEIKNKEGLASNVGNLAILYEEMGKYDQAMEAYNRALKIFIELDDKYSIASCYDNIGLLYKTRRDLVNAQEYLMQAMIIRQQLNDDPGICASYINMGELNIVKEQYNDALHWTNMALTYAVKIKSPVDVRYAYYNLSRIYKGMNKADQALYFHEKYAKLKDSISGIDKAKQIAELETKYRTAKREKELVVIKEAREKEREKHALDKQRQNTIIIILVVSVGFVGIILFLIYRQYNEKKKTNILLERRNAEIEEQKELIEIKSLELFEKNKEITDSIRYARRIQEAILPTESEIKARLKESFIFFRPKDIVSGDFYFFETNGEYTYIAVGDCTGHGVPGAFMSLVSYNLVKHAIFEHGKSLPSDILVQANHDLSVTLRQQHHEHTVNDGMDISLVRIHQKTGKIDYACANHHLYVACDGEVLKYKGTNRPVGAYMNDKGNPFQTFELDAKPGSIIYLLSDGFADQFGGAKGKKFKYKPFEGLLKRISAYDLNQQHDFLKETLDFWMGDLEQNDDICIVGIRV